MQECHNLSMLPVDEVQIESIWMSEIRFGKSIHNKAAGRVGRVHGKAYLAETAELVYCDRNISGEWGLVCIQYMFRENIFF